MHSSDFGEQIQQGLEGLEKPVVLVVVNPLYYQQVMGRLAKYMIEKYSKGLYISLNKPYPAIRKIIEREGLDASKLYFVDLVTETEECEQSGCLLLGKTPPLTHIGIGVDRAIEKHKDFQFVIFDSLSTLLIYNDSKSVARFGHVITERLRGWDLSGAVISVDLAEKDVISQLAQFCDAMLKMG